MGFFSNLISGVKTQKEEKVLPWIPLNTLEQLDQIEKTSKSKLQVIFKHSTRCGMSRVILNRFIDGYNLDETHLDLYFLDVINYRDVSNEVGYKFQIIHESPQLLAIKNGLVVAHESHSSVNAIDLSRFV